MALESCYGVIVLGSRRPGRRGASALVMPSFLVPQCLTICLPRIVVILKELKELRMVELLNVAC